MRKLRVLHIEDSERDVAIIARELASDYETVSKRVENAKGLREALAENVWDVILCDSVMSRFDALAALKLLQSTGIDIPFIVISGTVGEDFAVKAMVAGANDYLTKENLSRLVPAIERDLKDVENRRERKKAEASHRASEERLRAIYEAEPECVKLLGNKGELLDMNPAGLAMIGADSLEQVRGKSILHVIMPEYRKAFSALNRKVFKGESGTMEFEIVDLKGEQRWLVTHATPLLNDQGEVEALIGVTRDITEHKQAEAELSKSREHMARAQKVAKLGSWEMDLSTMDLIWSDETYRIFESDFDSFQPTYQGFLKFVHADDLAAVDKTFIDSASQYSNCSIKHRILMPDGRIKFIDEQWDILRDADDRAVTAVGTCQDITARTLAEASQRESEERLRLLFEQMRDGFYLTTPDGRLLDINPAMVEMFGYSSREEMLKVDVTRDLYFPREERKSRASDAEAYRMRRKDGSAIWVEDRGQNKYDEEGNIAFHQGILRDVTERKTADEKLIRSEEQYRDLVENSREMICTHDLEGRLLSVNRAAAEVLGYNPMDNGGGENLRDILVPEFRDQFDDYLTRVRRDGFADGLMIIQTSTGQRRIWEYHNTLRTEGVAVPMVRGMARDITDSKRAEEERQLVFDIAQGVMATPDLTELFKLIHRSIGKLMYAGNCFIGLHDRVTDLLHFEYCADKFDPVPPPQPPGKGFASYVLRTNQPLLLTKELRDRINRSGEVERSGRSSASWLGVPLRTPSGAIGVLVVQHYEDEDVYSQRDLEFLTSVGDQIAMAIERKLTDESLQKSEERYRDLVENAYDMIYTRDIDGNNTSINAAGEKLTGYTRDEFLQLNMSQIVVPEHFERAKEIIAQKVAGNEGSTYEMDILGKDGRRITLEVNTRVMHYHGVAVGVQGIVRDITERRMVEEQLIKSEEQYRDLVENAHDIIYSHDLEGNYTSINASCEQITGYTAKEALSMSFVDILAPGQLENAKEMIALKIRGESVSSFEQEIIAKDGRLITLEINTKLVSQEGVPVGIQGIARDITQRKLDSQAIKQADERAIFDYEQLLERVASLALVLGNARELKPIFEALRGFASVSAPMNAMFITLFDPEHGVRNAAYAWSEGHEVDINTLPPMEMTGSPHSRAVAENKIIVTDDFQSATKGQPGVNVGLDIDPRLPRSSLVVPMSVMGRVVGGVEIQSLELKAYTMSHATAIQLAANLAANAIDNVRLIDTERSQTEQLRQSQKLESIGRLTGGIAHDFNNMLTAINGFSDLSLRQLDNDHPVSHNLGEIKKAGERAATLTSQLLAFSRNQILRPEVVVINDTSNMLKRVIGEDIELVAILKDTVGLVKVDPGQLSQIVINLAVNARDAMPGGGKLTIETANIFLEPDYALQHLGILPGASVVLSVSDTGTGMTAELQEKIFEPFFTTKEVGKGTGLGLATVHGIVKQSGGDIFVYSEVGHGTTFKIYLPRVMEESDIVEANSDLKTEFAMGTETILLVEDEDLVRSLSHQILETCGYTVIEARDGIEALELMEKKEIHIDLLFTDVVMPRMGGRELAEKLHSKIPDLPVLFASGYTDDAIVRHGVLETNVNFIQKPFPLDDLARKVRELLDAKK
ncbi:MAG: PAS domain S-box protein [Pyrinomonadaceae bacterium]